MSPTVKDYVLFFEPKTCWPDYEGVSLVERTRLFLDAYIQAYRYYYARRVDVDQAKTICPIPELQDERIETLPDSVYTQVWKGRQAADRLMMPYDLYCMFYIEICDKTMWTVLPEIGQMYAARLWPKVKAKWDEHIQSHLLLPESSSSSSAYHSYLTKISQSRCTTDMAKSLLDKNLLDPAQVSWMLGDHILSKVKGDKK